ncbi:uncharacterized protein LOC128872915 isoform X2 [Hylaeus volcanicus]|uniref:uncharacterized protein LOC128872915 isoform X2 n=1 Tax=Hylaeus volcanicus TaxID=313075 RepID=UPI0023B775C9|nr:uncharacterized protein LOC128872915 isoform X2 [Hylaeus volcanicus]
MSEALRFGVFARRNCECDQFVGYSIEIITDVAYRPTRKHTEAHRALELLEDYHAKLTRPQDKQLRLAIERVIRIFKSRLFQALLGKKLKLLTCVTSFGSLNFM